MEEVKIKHIMALVDGINYGPYREGTPAYEKFSKMKNMKGVKLKQVFLEPAPRQRPERRPKVKHPDMLADMGFVATRKNRL